MMAALAGLTAAWLAAADAAGPAAQQQQPPLQQQPFCSPQNLASVPMSTMPNGTVRVPVWLNGHSLDMEVDTGSATSSLGAERARAFAFTIERARVPMSFINDAAMWTYTKVDQMQLGNSVARDVSLYIAPPQGMLPDAGGLIGQDIMTGYDVEFDFAAGRFQMFMPDNCSVPPVTWTHGPYAEVPLTVWPDGHVTLPATLDGAAVDATLDTGSPRSTISLEKARDLFSWDDDDPRLVRTNSELIASGMAVPIYRFPFRELSFAGVRIDNPAIDVVPQTSNPDIDVLPQKTIGLRPPLVLGMSVLRRLHLYIGYKAQKLYLTDAEAR